MSKALTEYNNRLETLVSGMIKIGTERTTTGNYIFDYYNLPEQFEFICENKELITDMLLEHDEVLDVDLHNQELDIIFALDYCKNVELEEVESVVLNAETKINQIEFELFSEIRDCIKKHIGKIQRTKDV